MLQRVHLEFAGPFQGMMFLVVVNTFSKWPPNDIHNCVKDYQCLGADVSVYGIPEHIFTDNGLNLHQEILQCFPNSQGVHHMRSAPYHPATNRLAERFVQSLKQGMEKLSHLWKLLLRLQTAQS